MLDIIYSRRSVRKYKNTPVEKEKLNEVLKAAMYAPSACNKQPWHYILCTDRQVINKVRSIHPYASMLDSAPACIIVCGDSELEYADGSYVQDCAASTQNILLAAKSLGLDTCWLGIYPTELEPKFSELFKLPDTIKPFCAIAIGYGDEQKQKPDRFDENKIHYNKW